MGIKISVIAKKSGVPASTIRYYVKEGLLPEPEKKNKSMSYYDESCIDKLLVIRKLQESRYYPLSVIKNIVKRMDEGMSLEEAESIDQIIFGDHDAKNPIDKKGFMEMTGLGRDEIKLAEDLGLLMPFIVEKGKKLYDHEDIRFGQEVLKPILNMGAEFKDIEFYVSIGQQIMEHEESFRKRVVAGKSKKEKISYTTEISRMVETIRGYIFKRLLQRMIQDKIQKSFARDSV